MINLFARKKGDTIWTEIYPVQLEKFSNFGGYEFRAEEFTAQQDVREAVTIEPIKKPHRVMTPEEYAEFRIVGWHQVCKNVDLAGNVGIRYLGDTHAVCPVCKRATFDGDCARDDCGLAKESIAQ